MHVVWDSNIGDLRKAIQERKFAVMEHLNRDDLSNLGELLGVAFSTSTIEIHMQIVMPKGMGFAQALREGNFCLTSEGKAYSFIDVGSTFDMRYEANPAQEVLAAWLAVKDSSEWATVQVAQVLEGDLIKVPDHGDVTYEVKSIGRGALFTNPSQQYTELQLYNKDLGGTIFRVGPEGCEVLVKRTTEME